MQMKSLLQKGTSSWRCCGKFCSVMVSFISLLCVFFCRSTVNVHLCTIYSKAETWR